MAVFEGTRQVETGIVRGGVSNPFIILVNMGRLGMPGLISEVAAWSSALLLGSSALLLRATPLLLRATPLLLRATSLLRGASALLVLGGARRLPRRTVGRNMTLRSTAASATTLTSATVFIALRV
jgi:hypothetical protein